MSLSRRLRRLLLKTKSNQTKRSKKRSNNRLKPIESSFTGELEERGQILIYADQRTEVSKQEVLSIDFVLSTHPAHYLQKFVTTSFLYKNQRDRITLEMAKIKKFARFWVSTAEG